MGYSLLADFVLVLHGAFILFILLGGLLVLRWRYVLPVHLLAAVWGALIEFAGWVCPLTPLENALRRLAGERGYQGSFVEHYLLPVIYPESLTRGVQIVLGIAVIVTNLVVYGFVSSRIRRSRAPRFATEPRGDLESPHQEEKS